VLVINAPALTDLIAGQIELLFPSLGSSIEYVKTGKVRALAVTSATRSDAVPDVPTVAERLPGYQAASFYGIASRAPTARSRVAAVSRDRSSSFLVHCKGGQGRAGMIAARRQVLRYRHHCSGGTGPMRTGRKSGCRLD
jgi:hypothetical protein